jgi:hypothetical protein
MYSHAKENRHSMPADKEQHPAHAWQLLSKTLVAVKISRMALILIAIFIHFSAVIGADAKGRVALVLACEDYESFKDSTISAKWARELGQALKEQNFDITVAVNSKDAETRAVLREFSLKAEQADFALIVVGGHIVGYQNQSFFLPQNARIQRATDLFSRALSLATIADIGSKAKSAAVLLLMTVPDIPSSVTDLDARPATSGLPAANVVTVFSSSPRVPVSGVDRVSEQAAEKLLDAAREKPLTLTALVKSASADGIGLVFGEVSPTNLSAPLDRPGSEDRSKTDILEAAAKAQAEAERKAREASIARDQAEERARDAEERARQAQEEASKVSSLRPIQPVEDSLNASERLQVQRRLQALRLYRGRIDAVFGDLTREAIREFQKLAGAPETGYLTRSEFERLVDTQ